MTRRNGGAARSEHLTEREIDATLNALARFIGIETYEAAVGGVRRDLFSDDTRTRVPLRCGVAGYIGARQKIV